MHLILSHENADFDAVASMLAAHKLYPDGLPVLTERQNRNVVSFLALYRNGLPFISRDDYQAGRIRQITLVDARRPPQLRGVKPTTPLRIIDHHPLTDELGEHETFTGDEVGANTTLMVEMLQQHDITLTTLEATQLPLLDLTQYTTVVIGPRAYETSAELRAANPRLFAWVREGGTLVVQYGQFEMAQPGMMPHQVQFSRPAARVTREDAPVRILDAQSRLLRWPNRLAEADWSDWVQERALYMPSTIDERYRTPLAMQDPEEPEQRGAILDLPMGRGRYVYTSLSLFRQLPGGVPGGARLFVNLISAGVPEGPMR